MVEVDECFGALTGVSSSSASSERSGTRAALRCGLLDVGCVGDGDLDCC